MNTHADNTPEHHSQALPSADQQQQSDAGPDVEILDNRTEGIAQRKLRTIGDHSPSARQHQAIQEIAEQSPQGQRIAQFRTLADRSTPQPPAIQRKENRTGLPDRLKSGIEQLSGYSLDAVKVHYNSARPAQFQAHAYAQGTDIHLGSGQESHLPHEAWHVVQQMQGRVQPTLQMKGGAYVNDQADLELEADAMGAKAASAGEPVSTFSGAAAEVAGGNPSGALPIQRKIGFEMEYAVPLSSTGSADLAILTQDTNTADAGRRMSTYLTGGPAYANDRPFSSGSKYKIHVDHELELQKAHVQLVRRLMADRMMGDWRGGEHRMIAIPEYVTEAFDEMAAYSTKTIRDTLTAVSTHMQQVFGVARNGMQAFPGANGFHVGVPSQDFKDYYDRHRVDRSNLDPILNRIEAAIQDRIAPQATVGIIPSAIFKAHQNLLTKGHMTTDRGDPAIAGTDALRLSIDYTVDVMEAIASVRAFSELRRDHRIAWDELKGLVTLITHYIIGEAYYRSSGFEDYKAVKNAVPLMSKIWLHTVINSAPSLQRYLTDPMIQTLTRTIRRHPYYDPDQVRRAMNVNLRTQKLSGKPLGDDATMLKNTSTDQLIAGVLTGTAIDHRGQRFGGADAMIAALRAASDNQSGIPLEYRRLSIRPSAAGLLAALWPLVVQSRELNMRHMSDVQQQNTLWWADTTRTEAAGYYAGQAVQGLRNVVTWGRGFLPQWG